jgi:hemoglobin
MSARPCSITSLSAVVFLGALLAGCRSEEPRPSPPAPMSSAPRRSLYERLGGERAIAAVVDDFVERAIADPQVNFTRKGSEREWRATPENIAHFERMLVQFIAMASGGPQKYEGRDLRSVHQGMKISKAEFDALVADLRASMSKLAVPAKEASELLAIIGTVRKDVVEGP